MIRKIFVTALLLFSIACARAQQPLNKSFIGRWQVNHNNTVSDLIFFSDSTGAFVSPTGLLYNYIKYTTEPRKRGIKLLLTIDVNRKKHPNYTHTEASFLNDSTFLIAFNVFFDNKIDTNTKNVAVYHKIKTPKPGTELHNADFNVLLGGWTNGSKNKPSNIHIIFKDQRRAEFIKDATVAQVIYAIDFTKQPIPIDFYSPDTKKILQAYLAFSTEDSLRIEFFPGNNRDDHFTIFGDNTSFVRQKPMVAQTTGR